MRTKTFASALTIVTLALAWSAQSKAAPLDGTSHWTQSSVELVVDDSLEQIDRNAYEAVVGAVTAWQREESNLPTLVPTRGNVDDIGFRRGQGNKSTIRYVPGGASVAKGALGVTIVTSEAATGRIVDADIVLNGEFAFAMLAGEGDTGMPYDLQNVLTHEVGHLLGLPEENDDAEATMYATSRSGEVQKRDLNATDKGAVAKLYEAPPTQDEVAGCGGAMVAPQDPGRSSWWPLLAMTVLIRRHRRKEASRPGGRGASFFWMMCALLLSCAVLPGEVEHPSLTPIGSSLEDGIIWTHFAVGSKACAHCTERIVSLPGGTHEGLRQEVNALRLAPGGAGCTSH